MWWPQFLLTASLVILQTKIEPVKCTLKHEHVKIADIHQSLPNCSKSVCEGPLVGIYCEGPLVAVSWHFGMYRQCPGVMKLRFDAKIVLDNFNKYVHNMRIFFTHPKLIRAKLYGGIPTYINFRNQNINFRNQNILLRILNNRYSGLCSFLV